MNIARFHIFKRNAQLREISLAWQYGSAVSDRRCVHAAGIVGQILGIASWLTESHIEYNTITVDTLQQVGPALTDQNAISVMSLHQTQALLAQMNRLASLHGLCGCSCLFLFVLV